MSHPEQNLSEHNLISQGSHGHHVISMKTLVTTLSALLVLTVLTVWTSRLDFGHLNKFFLPLQMDLQIINIFLAMGIASLKTALVVSFFMGLKYDKPFTKIVFLSSFVFLGVFILYTLSDTLYRGRIHREQGITIPFDSPVKINKGNAAGNQSHEGQGH